MTKPKTPDAKLRSRDGAEGVEAAFGTWLRRQREARGVTLREIADSTRISIRYLEALETDRFEALPAMVFARGFLREYARVVGLDPDEVVNLYLVAARSGQPPEEVVPGPAERQTRVGSPWGYGLLLGAAMVALLAVAVALSFWAERRSRATPPAVASVVPPPATESLPQATPAARPDAGAPVVATPEGEAPQPAAAGFGPAAVPTIAGVPAAASFPTVAASPVPAAVPPAAATVPLSGSPAAPAAPLVVTLSFSGDCWLEAVVDGRRRPGELKIAGETLTLGASDAVVLTLGNRAGVAVVANGRPVQLPGGTANVVRGLRIDRGAYPPADGDSRH